MPNRQQASVRRLFSFAALAVAASTCSKTPATPAGTPWTPGITYTTPAAPVYRGLVDRRGLIHAHSINSHDACDSAPRLMPDGTVPVKDYAGTTIPNAACFADFRNDLCKSKHDFVFLTDHRGLFDSTPFPALDKKTDASTEPDTAAYAPSRGDKLIARDGHAVANLTTCPDGHTALIIPGHEGNNLMPVGLESHPSSQTYGADTDPKQFPGSTAEITAAIADHHAHGAVVLVAHPENLSKEELVALPIDGFEMYNVHANTLYTGHGIQAAATLIGELPPNVPEGQGRLPANPDTVFLAIFSEDAEYLTRWGYALSKGVKRVTTMGSDCHRNSLPQILPDHERIDSYRRVMGWFSNHLLATPDAQGNVDDLALKKALKAGRAYGTFEVLGYPIGFDYHAEVGGAVSEMGDEVSVASQPVFHVTMPTVQNLDPAKEKPELTIRIMRAIDHDTGWVEVAKGTGDVTFAPTEPGAYRAEVRSLPKHLRQEFGPVADDWLSHDYVWIYSNAIYVK